MDIQAEKIELTKLLLNTNSPEVIQSIKNIFSKFEKTDFWNELTEEQKASAERGLDDVKNGEVVSYDSFIEKYK